MVAKVFHKIKETRFLRNLLVLVSGSMLAQLIGIVASPILSRLYSPADFGVIGVIMGVVGLVSVLGSLKYEMALVVESDDSKAERLQTLCWRLLLASTVLSGVAILPARLWMSHFINDETLLTFLPWAFPIIFLTGLYEIYSFRLNRERRYKSLSTANVSRRLSLVLTQVFFGFCGAQALGLILGNLIGAVVAVLVLLLTNRKILLFTKASSSDLKDVAKEHYRFAVYSAPQQFMNSLSQYLPVYLLGVFYGAAEVGSYWFAMRLLQLPAGIVGQSIRQIYYKEAAELINDWHGLRTLFRKTTFVLTCLIIPLVLVISIYGEEIFNMIFGEEWKMAGQFSQWMMIWIGGAFINPPAMALFSICGKQKILLVYDTILLCFRFIIMLCMPLLGCSSITVVAAYSLLSLLFYIVVIFGWNTYLRNKSYDYSNI